MHTDTRHTHTHALVTGDATNIQQATCKRSNYLYDRAQCVYTRFVFMHVCVCVCLTGLYARLCGMFAPLLTGCLFETL